MIVQSYEVRLSTKQLYVETFVSVCAGPVSHSCKIGFSEGMVYVNIDSSRLGILSPTYARGCFTVYFCIHGS